MINPRGGGGALTGDTHARALFTAPPIAALEVVETQFTAVAVLSLHVLLSGGKTKTQVKYEKTFSNNLLQVHVVTIVCGCTLCV